MHTHDRGVYGAVRVHAELTMGQGNKVSQSTVALLMQRANIQGVTGHGKRHYVPPQTTAKGPGQSKALPRSAKQAVGH
jgi:putative transposase